MRSQLLLAALCCLLLSIKVKGDEQSEVEYKSMGGEMERFFGDKDEGDREK